MKLWKALSKYSRTSILSYGLILIAYAIIMPMQSSGNLSDVADGLLIPTCIYIVLALSLNLTVGVLGELSLGHAGFMSIGAFSGVIVSLSLQDQVQSAPLLLILSIVVGGIMAGIAGLIIGIPVLRLRGDYLAIVTLAFGEIIKNIISCLYVGKDANGLHFSFFNPPELENGRVILSGPKGASELPEIATFTAAIILVLFTLFVVINLMYSRTGRAITAIRDNRIAAESVGIGVTRYKLTTFIISAMLAGMAGTMFAMNQYSVTPDKFDFNRSIAILVFVVLGGMGNIIGSIIATVALQVLPEMLREFDDYRMLLYSIVLIVVMLATNSKTVKMIGSFLVDKVKALLNLKKKEAESDG